jgi:hypothetical protein
MDSFTHTCRLVHGWRHLILKRWAWIWNWQGAQGDHTWKLKRLNWRKINYNPKIQYICEFSLERWNFKAFIHTHNKLEHVWRELQITWIYSIPLYRKWNEQSHINILTNCSNNATCFGYQVPKV